MEPLVNKYQVKSLKEIYGEDEAINRIKRFILNFNREKKKAALLYGPSGTGKTSVAYALSHDFNLELLEVNASDFRNKEQISYIVGEAIKQQSLFAKGKLILIDEVDGLSTKEDRGGLQALMKLISKSPYPIIITMSNPWDNKYSKLRRLCNLIEFKPVDSKAILKILKKICNREGIKYEEEALKGLSIRAGGDVRAAINDLQILATGKNEITKTDLRFLSDRERQENMINALIKIFKTTNPEIAIKAFDYIEEDVNEQLLWIDENLPLEYEKPKDLAKAYDKLSKADVFNSRIKRWQYWRFLVYIKFLLTLGIALSKDKKYNKIVKYKPTTRLLKLWWAKQKSLKKRAIATKLSEKTHCSIKEALKDMYYLKIIFKKDKQMSEFISKELELSEEEICWLKE